MTQHNQGSNLLSDGNDWLVDLSEADEASVSGGGFSLSSSSSSDSFSGSGKLVLRASSSSSSNKFGTTTTVSRFRSLNGKVLEDFTKTSFKPFG